MLATPPMEQRNHVLLDMLCKFKDDKAKARGEQRRVLDVPV
jgi:hypothetical protein